MKRTARSEERIISTKVRGDQLINFLLREEGRPDINPTHRAMSPLEGRLKLSDEMVPQDSHESIDDDIELM
jgi:hypothetical protein